MVRKHLTTVMACSVATTILLAYYLSYTLARSTMRTMTGKAGWSDGSMVIQHQAISGTRYPHWHIKASGKLFPDEDRIIVWHHCLTLTGASIGSHSDSETAFTGEPPYCALATPEW